MPEKTIKTRPWGTYEVIAEDDGYKVKRITVFSAGCLSLQSHNCRDEHWVVVQGQATVTVHDDISHKGVGDSVHIPLGAVHRLANETETDMVLIEVQIGPYLGEDDITRFDDIYGR